MNDISNLESSCVFHFFEQISKFPRSSGDEHKIAQYLVDFAKKRNLFYYIDELNNVIIKKYASAGYENSKPIAIQGHIDMVCEKNKDKVHDFFKDPIEIIYENDFIKANNTTLGADNGIAIAMMLTILDSNTISHPSIEAIFTTSEEVGMEGAIYLDMSILNSRILLNLDSEDEGVFTVGCAGGFRANLNIPINWDKVPINYETYTISLTGLLGGHSGTEINKERANANILLLRTLYILIEEFDLKICEIDGGSKDNAIPREAYAVVLIDKNIFNKVNDKLKDIINIYNKEYKNIEPSINLFIEKTKNVSKYFDEKTTKNILSVFLLLPNGILNMNKNIENLPETSINIGVVKCNEDELKITASVRSCFESKKEFLKQKLYVLSNLIDAKISFTGDYPGWEYKEESFIKQKCLKIYKEMHGEEAKVDIIHAGLECGVFYNKIPDIDIISFGPNIYDAHTPCEKASISSIDRVWKFLLKLFKEMI